MRKTISAIMLILTLSLYIEVDASDNKLIPNDAIEFNNHSYKLFNSGCTQKQAIEICENLGGHLLTITSEEEQIFINGIVENCTMKNIWLGGTYTNNEWNWITDEAFNYSNWNNGEPNNVFNSQNAIMMYTYQGIDNDNNTIEIGKWNDENENGRDWDGYTSQETGFICEWDFLPIDNSYIADTNNQEPLPIKNNDSPQTKDNDIQDEDNNINQSMQYREDYKEYDNQSNDNIEKENNNDKGFNITFHIDNLSLIGGVSIFGGISFIGVIIKNRKSKKNKRSNSSNIQ